MNRILQGCGLAALLILGALLTGCAGSSSSSGEFNMIVVERTPLFQQGPQQQTPPDSYLERGTRIRIVSPEGNFAKIETVMGQSGFIAADAIGPAPNENSQAAPQIKIPW